MIPGGPPLGQNGIVRLTGWGRSVPGGGGQTGFVEATPSSLYQGHRYPMEIISHCGWLYHRFPLSLRELEEMMLARGVLVTSHRDAKAATRFVRKLLRGL